MALRGDLIRRVTTFLHGYNNISPAHSISLDAPPWGEGIFKFLESNKQTHFRRVFFDRQQKGERSGKLVTTLKTSKSRWRPPGKNRQERGKPVSRKQLFLSDEGNDDGRARCWKTPFVAFPSRFPGKEKGPRAGEREVG